MAAMPQPLEQKLVTGATGTVERICSIAVTDNKSTVPILTAHRKLTITPNNWHEGIK